MSHERTPLNAIIGVTEMLREDAEASEPLDQLVRVEALDGPVEAHAAEV
jgi:signal transduction histidine kinase